ncbi:DUF3631 domain-containing protein [Lamprocystis purpurea]|uniref:DUF3631 domain-containing protein n=1 Tax=Lamprocystis purpurea TaxID=61598 RepID=UPI00146C47C2|nr:DUF3631 domain-containing protein [Lamprocystis purpurea]
MADTIKAAIDPLTFYQRELSNAPPLIANRKGYAQKVLCPFHEEKDPSFTINAKTGAFRCFSCDKRGGSIIDFIMLRDGLELNEARATLADTYHLNPDATPAKQRAKRPQRAPTPGDLAPAPVAQAAPLPLVPIPREAMTTCPKRHPTLGEPSGTWTYRDRNNDPVALVLRFDPAGARKQFRPLSWTAADGWQWCDPPGVLPLYGLELLADRPAAPVLFCEGEKAADAASWLFPGADSVTTMHGANAPQKSDFAPIGGRRVLIWPDHDPAGAVYANTLTELCKAAGAASVEILDLSSLAIDPRTGAPRDLPEKWDAANARSDDWTPAALTAAARWIQVYPAAPAMAAETSDAAISPDCPTDQAAATGGERSSEGDPERPQDNRDAATIARLAALPVLEYDRVRESEASALGVRVATLDREVAKARQSDAPHEAAAGRNVTFYEPEPWTDAVSGAEVLDQALSLLLRHMVMRPEDAAAVALWCAHVYLFAGFSHSPRLLITAPDAECGKTMLLFHMVGNLVPRPQPVELMKSAPFFRLAELHKPTFLIDEMDVFIDEDSELLAAVNNGWEPHGCVLRCIGDDNEVRKFGTHTPVAMAGIDLIKKLPGTTVSRSVVVTLERAAADEISEANIYDARTHRAPLLEVGRKLARWTGDHAATIAAADPIMPVGVRNRLADKWRPLLAIADAAGGRWPALARSALAAQIDEREPSKALLLLADIREILRQGEQAIPTANLIERLCAIEESPWKDYNYKERDDERRRITSRQLATLLKRYQIASGNVHIGGLVPKGYRVEHLTAACNRYLPRVPPELSAHPLPSHENKVLGSIYPLPSGPKGSRYLGRNALNNKKGSGRADNLGGSPTRHAINGPVADGDEQAQRYIVDPENRTVI